MRTARLRRTAILFLLTAVLAVPLASAAGPPTADPRPARAGDAALPGLFDRLLSFLRHAWSKEGCNLDPNGHCLSGTALPTVQTDIGCNIDPNGQCHT